jgi:hypothetical protein
MTKQKWLEHMRAAGEHDTHNCDQCEARRNTWAKNRAAKVRNQARRDCGLKKVRGTMGGTFWE